MRPAQTMAMSLATAAIVAACGPSRAPRSTAQTYSLRQLQGVAGASETACGLRRKAALAVRDPQTIVLRFSDQDGVSLTQFQCLMEMLRPTIEQGVSVIPPR